MQPAQVHSFAAALALLLLATAPAFADYATSTYWQDHGPMGPAASAQVETYDGVGPAGGGLSAGQARITVNGALPGAGQPYPGQPGTVLAYNGVNIAFLTDLNLQPSQVSTPANWSMQIAPVDPGVYQLSATDANDVMTHTNVTFLISGLGGNATQRHFLLGRHYADWGMSVSFPDIVPGPAPEPATGILAALAVTALLGCRLVAQRRI